MHKILAVLFFFFVVVGTKAQISPVEGAKLYYRLIGFTFPTKQGVSNYKIEIAAGTYNNEDSFKKNIIAAFSSHKNKIIGEVPSFGKPYTWRAIYISSDPSGTNNNATKTKSELHHFSTLIFPEVDTSRSRLRIIQSAKKYKDAYVFLDETKALYDMKGMPVWFLPNIDRPDASPVIPATDLKPSSYGTITYMYKEGLYEINYNGTILWKGPDNNIQASKRSNEYHHEFTRLSNGRYMVLRNEKLLYKAHSLNDSSYFFPYSDSLYAIHKNDTNYQIFSSGTLVEYDKRGKLLWTWRLSKYIRESDLFYAIRNGLVSPELHDNAFFFDEQNKTIYISFRNISRIIKVKYPEGNVLNTYGEIYRQGIDIKGNKLFCAQHACRRSKAGYLYLFNNNSCNPDSLSSIVILQEPLSPRDTLKKIWEYKIAMKDFGITETGTDGNGGGDVIELPDHSIFASMGYYKGIVFIVSKDKKITWSAIPERWNPETKKWSTYMLAYRASIIINRKELEHLVWNEGMKE